MVWRRISVGLTLSNILLYEIFDQSFTRSYNAVCTAQGISVPRTPIWQLSLAAILMLIPSLVVHTKGVLVFFVVLSVLAMFLSLDEISDQLSRDFDPWGECFTFQGDKYDQTLGLAAYFVFGCLFLAVTYPVCLVEVVWVRGVPVVRCWRAR
jgi:hypothetical protein